MFRKLSILVPVYNEVETVEQLLRKLAAVDFPIDREIICVDDGSTDGSREVLKRLAASGAIRYVEHGANQGKGAAVRTALRHAFGGVIVVQDADLELDPNDLLAVLDPVLSGATQVCFGTRFGRHASKALRWLPTYWANRVLTAISNLLNGQCISDVSTCYKMMTSEVASQLEITESGFAVEPEIVAQIARLGYDVAERPIRYTPRTAAEGKKIRAADFVRYVVTMVRCRFLPVQARLPDARKVVPAA